MGDDDAGHPPLPDNIQHDILDFACCRFIERRGWLIEEENFRSVARACGRSIRVSLASGEIAHVSVLIPRQTDALKESSNLFAGGLPAVSGP